MDGHTLDHAELVGRYRRPLKWLVVPVAILAAFFVVAVAFLYGVYRGVRFLARRHQSG